MSESWYDHPEFKSLEDFRAHQKRLAERRRPPHQISYWQVGHNDATSGRGYNQNMRHANGYDNGYRCAMGNPRPVDESVQDVYWLDGPYNGVEAPSPPLKNPYMEAMESLEGILTRLQNFTKEFPKALDTEKVQEYRLELLRVRDELSALRQQEMAGS